MKNGKLHLKIARKVLFDGIGQAIHKGLTIEVPSMFFWVPDYYENGRESVLEGKCVKLTSKNYNADPVHEPDGVISTLNIILAEGKDNSLEVWNFIRKDDFLDRYGKDGKIINNYSIDLVLDYRPARMLVRSLLGYTFCSVDLITK
jgi:hypothetical protein